MTLDIMNMDNKVGGRRRRTKGKNRKLKRGGSSLILDSSVPASLFLLHKYLKTRKMRKSKKKLKKRSRRRK